MKFGLCNKEMLSLHNDFENQYLVRLIDTGKILKHSNWL